MSYFAIGLNFKTACVAHREPYELDGDALEAFYREVGRLPKTEWLVLSTCNRTEIYGHGPERSVKRIKKVLGQRGGGWNADLSIDYRDDDAVAHVVDVITGLGSQILGDNQILSQTKEAYRAAATAGTLGPWMHRLMHSAFAAAKHVISTTGLGAGGSSVARAAVGTARQTLVQASHTGPVSCLVLGAGRMAQLVMKELDGYESWSVAVCNRTDAKADELAGTHHARSFSWSERYDALRSFDVVISATGSHETVINRQDILPGSADTEVTLIDIAVPRDIDPSLAQEPGFTVINIDGILDASHSASRQLEESVEAARAISEETVASVVRWEHQHDALQSAIHVLYQTFEAIRAREVERNIHRFVDEDHDQVDRLTRSIMQKLLAIPIVRLKMMADESLDLAERVELLQALFVRPNCEEGDQHPNPHNDEQHATGTSEQKASTTTVVIGESSILETV